MRQDTQLESQEYRPYCSAEVCIVSRSIALQSLSVLPGNSPQQEKIYKDVTESAINEMNNIYSAP